MLLLSLSLQKNGNLAYKLCIYNISMSEAHSMKIGEKQFANFAFTKKVSNYKGVPKFELNEHQGKLKVHCRVLVKRHSASESLWKY